MILIGAGVLISIGSVIGGIFTVRIFEKKKKEMEEERWG